VLSAAEGFLDIGDDDTFAQSQAIIQQLLKDLNKHANDWKSGTLTMSARQIALGALVDAVLGAVVSQILALEDIPEKESNHLAHICSLLMPLEELFTDEAEVCVRHFSENMATEVIG
jgi:centromere/kinetochore protein ZW10